jgi:hypothetical protein
MISIKTNKMKINTRISTLGLTNLGLLDPYFINKKVVHPNYNTAIVIPKEKELHKFIIKGCDIMAYSRKDAIKIFNHNKNK